MRTVKVSGDTALLTEELFKYDVNLNHLNVRIRKGKYSDGISITIETNPEWAAIVQEDVYYSAVNLFKKLEYAGGTHLKKIPGTLSIAIKMDTIETVLDILELSKTEDIFPSIVPDIYLGLFQFPNDLIIRLENDLEEADIIIAEKEHKSLLKYNKPLLYKRDIRDWRSRFNEILEKT